MNFDLETFFSKEEFILQTAHQISKDLAGLTANAPNWNVDLDAPALKQMSTQLQPILKDLEGDFLQQFIYKVDLKEQDFIRGLDARDDFELLSILIIKREAQKVYLRQQFSSH